MIDTIYDVKHTMEHQREAKKLVDFFERTMYASELQVARVYNMKDINGMLKANIIVSGIELTCMKVPTKEWCVLDGEEVIHIDCVSLPPYMCKRLSETYFGESVALT